MGRDPRFDRLRAATFAALRPPPRLDLADWIEEHVRLPGAISAAPGRMTLWPHQRDIAASIGDPGVERVTVLKSARVGYTQLLVAAIGASVANNPGPTLLVVPAEQDARHLMTQVIEPTFAESPVLRDALAADTSGRDVLLQRNFPGGSLSVVSARAPRNLRARTARDLYLDEVDGFEVDVRGEGDPVALAEKRTFSYGDRKIVMGSTPVDEDTSRILAAYRRSDQRVYECPCPHCDTFHEIAWKDIRWQSDRPETAAWACPSCGAMTDDRDKPRMVSAGRWRALRPDVQGHHGYRMNALVSLLPNAAWPKLAAEFLEAKRSPEVLKAFTTTVLAEPWRAAGEELDDSDLAGRVEPFDLDRLPPEVLILTAGVDVQHDRLECVTLGHTRDETLVLDQRAFWGAVNDDDGPWRELDQFLSSQWSHPAGGMLRLDAVAIDAGDGATMDKVLSFAHPRLSRRVVAIKGAPGNRPAIRVSATKGQRLFIVGVDGVKANLVERLRRGRSVRFAETLERRFFEELASERRVVRYSRGTPTASWERIPGRRAESLDCVVYALAVRGLVGVNLDAREAELSSAARASSQTLIVRSNWLAST